MKTRRQCWEVNVAKKRGEGEKRQNGGEKAVASISKIGNTTGCECQWNHCQFCHWQFTFQAWTRLFSTVKSVHFYCDQTVVSNIEDCQEENKSWCHQPPPRSILSCLFLFLPTPKCQSKAELPKEKSKSWRWWQLNSIQGFCYYCNFLKHFDRKDTLKQMKAVNNSRTLEVSRAYSTWFSNISLVTETDLSPSCTCATKMHLFQTPFS